MTLDFVHITDTHISVNREDTEYKALGSSSALLKDAIEQINSIKGLDFVLFGGDMVDSPQTPNLREYYTLLTKLKYPTLNAFGNHDLTYDGPDRDQLLKLVKKCNPNYTFDETYYAFSPKTDYRIIVLDSVINDRDTTNGELTPEQLEFLDKELSQNEDKIVVIAMHHPSVEPFVAKEHSLLNASEFNEILLKYKNPIIVLSGHYHAAKIRRMGNLVFVSSPALATYPMAFRHIKIVNFKDRVSFKFETINTRLTGVREGNRQNVISYSTLAGCEKDRNTEFIFYKSRYKSPAYKKAKIENASKETTTSKKEIKKLSEPKPQKVKKERKLFKKQNTKNPPAEVQADYDTVIDTDTDTLSPDENY